MTCNRFCALVISIVLSVIAADAFALPPQTTAFTYQGQLNAGGILPSGQTYQFTFTLYDALTGGNPVGTPIQQAIVVGSGGLFTTDLDFGQVFDGTQYWLEIKVGTQVNNEQPLAARQRVSAVPVAQYALKSAPNAFADFFALMPPDNASTVAVGADVEFPQDGPASGSGAIVRAGASSFILTAAGTYQVSFQVSVIEAGQLVLVVNGVEQAYTVVGRATGTSQIVGIALITTPIENSIVSVRNPAGSFSALTITPVAGGATPVSAHLVITQLR